MLKVSRGMITGAALGAVMLNATPSFAALDKCQAALEKATNTLRSKTIGVLKLCADAVRKEQVLNTLVVPKGSLAKAADTCQKQIAKILDTNGNTGKTERIKFNEAIDKAFTKPTIPTCNDVDLARLGHMVSGTGNQAPGTLNWDFVKTYLAVQAIRSAQNESTAQVRDFTNLINAAKGAAATAPGTSTNKAATDCDLAPTCNYKTTLGCRPDVCNFDINCRTHSCTLKAPESAATVKIGILSSNLALVGRSSFEICTLEGEGYGIGNTGDGYLIMGGPSRQLGSVNVAGSTVCIDTVAAEGFCSAGGATFNGKSKDLNLCQDRLIGNGNACTTGSDTGVGATFPTSCLCDSGGNIPCGPDTAPCSVGKCGVTDTGAACFPGTETGSVKLNSSGATGAGDCVVLNSTAFTTLGAGDFGTDGVPCTFDDDASPAAVATTPFTTGSAEAHLHDNINSTGTCTNNPTSTNCIENANCEFNNTADTCDSPSLIADQFVGPLNGAPLVTLTNFETSNLSGLTLAGAFPAAGSATGDLVTGFITKCQ